MNPILGRPGVRPVSTAVQGFISRDGNIGYWPRGAILDGFKTRDPSNIANILALRPGLALGRVTATGHLANSIICLTGGALTGTGTSLTLPLAGAAELYRRVGPSGTFNLIGPPTASGVVRTITPTYSAINLGTGAVTITAIGVNDVQTTALGVIMTAGSIVVFATDYLGVRQSVKVAFNTSWTQTVADIQTALNAALGAAAVVCAVTNTHDFSTTFSGTNYAGVLQPLMAVDVSSATGPTLGTVTHTTNGINGAFVTGSVVTDTDGSGTPTTFIGDGVGALMSSDSRDIELPQVPCSLIVDVDRFIDYPADASLKAWVRNSMSTLPGGKFIFSDVFP